MRLRFFILFSLLFAQVAISAESDQSKKMTAEQFEASLHYQKGHITLPGGIASLDIGEGFRYVGPKDAERVLVDAWGNPPGSGALGMLFPADVSPLDRTGWGVVITYSKDGHVSDEDAGSIDYDELLQKMIKQTADANEKRREQGYGTVDLIGWAEPPRYDQGSHKLYWAKELRFDGSKEHTLNYSIRILGREGVLELNAVSSMAQLGSIKGEMQDVLAFTNFDEGNRYADFNPDTDKVAAYGLAALIGGAVAAKAGLFAKLFALLLAAKKLVAAAVVGAGVALKKLLSRNKPA